jgi:hypothetical protein
VVQIGEQVVAISSVVVVVVVVRVDEVVMIKHVRNILVA